MSRKKVYASVEIADREVRLAILEVFEGRINVLRVERVACQGGVDQKIVDEVKVVQALRDALNHAQAALGFRIERVLLAIPSVNVRRTSQRAHIQIEDGTKSIRLFHIQQGYSKVIQKKLGDDVELVNTNRISYRVNDEVFDKMPIDEECEDFYMDVDLLYADKTTIYSYVRCIEQANLEILDLCLDSYAIAQESAVQVKSEERNVVQLDLEANHCVLSLFADGKLMSCANLEKGYNSFIEELKTKYDLTDDVCFRLLQNIFTADEEDAGDVIVYIEQQEDRRVEISSKELMETCLPKIRSWIDEVNKACEPIIKQKKTLYVLTGKGADIAVMKSFMKQFNSDAEVYLPQSVGARNGAYVCCLGMIYAFDDINKIRHTEQTSPNNNELEASIDSIRQRSRSGEGGFTKKLKSVILTEED